MSNRSFRPDDQDGILEALGPAVPVILTESVLSGFADFAARREADADGFAIYRKATLANMLVDHIYPVLTDLTALADPDGQTLVARDTDNLRATELWALDAFYIKVKRVHDVERRASPVEQLGFAEIEEPEIIEFGLPRNVKTRRVWLQQHPQQSPLPGMPLTVRDDERAEHLNRLCLVCAFDLKFGDESIRRLRLGVCDTKHWLWTHPLSELSLDAIVQISPSLADRVDELRRERRA
ncbi:MAG: hypothetical protein AAF797_12410 [Planctomycetota bacterium]